MTYKFEYDSENGLLYVRVRGGEIAETIERDENVYMDVDAKGYVLGVEFLSLAALASAKSFEVPERLDLPHQSLFYDPSSIFKAVSSPAMASLDPQKREALQLRFLEGLDLPEIKSQLGLTLASTYRLLREALRELRQAMEESGVKPVDEDSFKAVEAELSKL